ncbi:MAG: hypothetical protein ACI3XG_06140, partial [Faecousia sp.]
YKPATLNEPKRKCETKMKFEADILRKLWYFDGRYMMIAVVTGGWTKLVFGDLHRPQLQGRISASPCGVPIQQTGCIFAAGRG